MKLSACMSVVSLLILSSCFGPSSNPEIIEMNFYNNAEISTDFPFVIGGNSRVFHYYHKAEDEENVADDEFSEDFFIQIEKEKDSFDYSDVNTDLIYHIYKAHCFCPIDDYSQIKTGFIRGDKITNTKWNVSADLTLETGVIDEVSGDTLYVLEREIKFNGTFKSVSIPE
ncbi:MAG: hypothetical protein O7F74_13005 [Bacteroidetes bacterium]|nr:hypothetical protein [Bacteroidota bacterium]